MAKHVTGSGDRSSTAAGLREMTGDNRFGTRNVSSSKGFRPLSIKAQVRKRKRHIATHICHRVLLKSFVPVMKYLTSIRWAER